MKTKKTRWEQAAALIAALLALGLALAGCDTGGGGGTGSTNTNTYTYLPVTYTLENGAELTVGRNQSDLPKAVITVTITPQANDYYILKHGAKTISSGKISGSGTTLTFSGTGDVTSFTVTVSGSTLTIKTEIKYKDAAGKDQTIPKDTPATSGTGGNASDGKGGSITVTNQQAFDENGQPLTGSWKVYAGGLKNGQAGSYDSVSVSSADEEVGSITNGKLSFTFPTAPEAQYLYDIKQDFTQKAIGMTSNTIKLNPASGVKWCTGYVYYEESSTYFPFLSYRSGNVSAMYIYSSADVTITGDLSGSVYDLKDGITINTTLTYSNNFKLSKGWNTVYRTSVTTNGREDVTMSNTAPTGMKWVVSDGISIKVPQKPSPRQ